MPPYSFEIIDDIAWFYVTEKASFEALDQSLEAMFEITECRHYLWDMREADLSDLTPSAQAKKSLQASKRYLDRRGTGARTAILVSSEADLLFARAMVALSATLNPVEVRSFLDLQKALNWLQRK